MPPELWLTVLEKLDYMGLKKISRVCGDFHEATKSARYDDILFRNHTTSRPLIPAIGRYRSSGLASIKGPLRDSQHKLHPFLKDLPRYMDNLRQGWPKDLILHQRDVTIQCSKAVDLAKFVYENGQWGDPDWAWQVLAEAKAEARRRDLDRFAYCLAGTFLDDNLDEKETRSDVMDTTQAEQNDAPLDHTWRLGDLSLMHEYAILPKLPLNSEMLFQVGNKVSSARYSHMRGSGSCAGYETDWTLNEVLYALSSVLHSWHENRKFQNKFLGWDLRETEDGELVLVARLDDSTSHTRLPPGEHLP